MKTLITYDDWKILEKTLMKLRIGYNVDFDDHNGQAEMLVNVNTIGIYRWDDNPEAIVKKVIEEGI